MDRLEMGSLIGAEKSAAAKAGVPVQIWRDNRANGLLWCFGCRDWKAANEFVVDASRSSGRQGRCKACMSEATAASRYGLSLDAYRAFRAEHGNRCGICEAEHPKLYVDHNHDTGKLRGLLCPSCNTAIGLLEENPARFAAALSYLERSK